MNKYLAPAKIASERYGISTAMLMAIVEIESAFDPFAMRYEVQNPWVYYPRKYAKMNRITSGTEEKLQHFSFGLCQIMGSTLRSPLNYSGPLVNAINPGLNLLLGAKYIKWLSRKYKDPQDLASAYNAGRPMRKNGEKKYHNQEYVDKFTVALKKWEDECRSISGH